MAKSHYPAGYSFIKKKKRPAKLPLLLVLLTVLLLPFCAAPFFAEQFWLADLASHFTAYYLLAAMLLFILLLLSKRPVAALLAFGIMGFQGYLLTSTWDMEGLTAEHIPPAAHELGTDTLSVVVHNISLHNTSKSTLVKKLQENSSNTEMVVLLEVTPEWVSYLEPLRKTYVYNSIKPQENAFGYAVFSRVPTTSINSLTLKSGYEIPVVGAYTADKLVPFTLYAVHTPPPLSKQMWEQRNAYLDEVGTLLQKDKNPNRLVVGDFNVTSFSPWFKRFSEQAKVSQPGRSLASLGTWPGILPAPLRLPIDHTFGSEGITATITTLGTYGSDHAMQKANYTLPTRKLAPLEAEIKSEAVPVLLHTETQGPPTVREVSPERRPVADEKALVQPDLETEMPAVVMPSVKLNTYPPTDTAAADQPTDENEIVPQAGSAKRTPDEARKQRPASQVTSNWGNGKTTPAPKKTVQDQDDLERRIAETR